jgi:HSP20 family protein
MLADVLGFVTRHIPHADYVNTQHLIFPPQHPFPLQNLKSSLEFHTKVQEDPSIELQSFSHTPTPFSEKGMSPFSQLSLAAGGGGYGNGIDRDFSPILHYIDELDRHFSRRHRFVNCFIPRFDLEEDAHNYYLYGDIPGAVVNDITVEAHDNHTLVIYGKTLRPGPGPREEDEVKGKEDPEFVKVMVEDHEHGQEIGSADHKPAVPISSNEGQQGAVSPVGPSFPPPPTQPVQSVHSHHQRYENHTAAAGSQQLQSEHRILLSERLVGDFHRTFAFPQPVVEEGVKASMENGVLSLVVPKRGKGEEVKKGRKVPIAHGKWWKGEDRANSGFGFNSGAV